MFQISTRVFWQRSYACGGPKQPEARSCDEHGRLIAEAGKGRMVRTIASVEEVLYPIRYKTSRQDLCENTLLELLTAYIGGEALTMLDFSGWTHRKPRLMRLAKRAPSRRAGCQKVTGRRTSTTSITFSFNF